MLVQYRTIGQSYVICVLVTTGNESTHIRGGILYMYMWLSVCIWPSWGQNRLAKKSHPSGRGNRLALHKVAMGMPTVTLLTTLLQSQDVQAAAFRSWLVLDVACLMTLLSTFRHFGICLVHGPINGTEFKQPGCHYTPLHPPTRMPVNSQTIMSFQHKLMNDVG